MDGRLRLAFGISVASHEMIQIVAVGPIRAESCFIEQAFDAATQANLIRMILEAYRPAHFAVPTTAENHHASRAQTSGHHAERP